MRAIADLVISDIRTGAIMLAGSTAIFFAEVVVAKTIMQALGVPH